MRFDALPTTDEDDGCTSWTAGHSRACLQQRRGDRRRTATMEDPGRDCADLTSPRTTVASLLGRFEVGLQLQRSPRSPTADDAHAFARGGHWPDALVEQQRQSRRWCSQHRIRAIVRPALADLGDAAVDMNQVWPRPWKLEPTPTSVSAGVPACRNAGAYCITPAPGRCADAARHASYRPALCTRCHSCGPPHTPAWSKNTLVWSIVKG
jgi:hypothetical protein